ncbi:putative transcriptional regulator [Desulfosporosinus acidiphilus SJ4]|uniref:Putative transcriptional regulator n=1 Tax=Desulfosporosinus acidiphilus (strain DSM 22704 / JCM 16185 / SJ4) TaxID=646529 RepID=I4DC72_DESAJ|nr:helix-turn-helix transcriptional regulator [Desulfosporosinus acidiphilus]AFM43396.1 putative transcriptional regulator [Desulfosporosinus acidiphilus SJ4]
MEKKTRQKRAIHHVDPQQISEAVGSDKEKTKLSFSMKLNELLNDKETAQEDLAKKTGLSMSSISTYRNGKAEPKITAFNEIAKVLDVSTDYLLGKTTIESRDEDMQISCKYTGLSEPAIKIIQNLGNEIDSYYYDTLGFKPPLLKILNTLYEEGVIAELTKAIGRCLYQIIVRDNYGADRVLSIEEKQRIMLPAIGYLNKEIADEINKVMDTLRHDLTGYYYGFVNPEDLK